MFNLKKNNMKEKLTGKLIKNSAGEFSLILEEVPFFVKESIPVTNGYVIAVSQHQDQELLQLSLKNCENIELGYDLDELVNEEFEKFDQECRIVYRKQLQESLTNMFQKAIELTNHNKFSTDDMIHAIAIALKRTQTTVDIIQDLQVKEWNVEIEMRSKNIDELRALNEGFLNNPNLYIPKLDSFGCLILKRII